MPLVANGFGTRASMLVHSRDASAGVAFRIKGGVATRRGIGLSGINLATPVSARITRYDFLNAPGQQFQRFPLFHGALVKVIMFTDVDASMIENRIAVLLRHAKRRQASRPRAPQIMRSNRSRRLVRPVKFCQRSIEKDREFLQSAKLHLLIL
jgi:hypothetical protein